MAQILTITPNPLIDHVATSSELMRGAVTRVQAYQTIAGGKGLNMARLLARHGHRVRGISFAGGWSGRLLAELIAADGVEPALVATRARTRVGFQVVEPAVGGSTAVLEDGFAVEPGEIESLLGEIARQVPGADLVLVGGSVPCPAANGLIRRAVELCAAAGVPCWVDSYGPAMCEALAGPHLPVVVKPNREEYAARCSWRSCTEVHVSDGPREVTVRLPGRTLRVTPPMVHEVNPVGSGDCYLAALAHARLIGLPLEDQLRYAAAAGAANAARADIAAVGPREIEPLMAAVRIEAG